MTVLGITHPLSTTVVAGSSSAGDGLANLLTPHPREAFAAAAAGQVAITLDLGTAQPVDTVFLGFTNAEAGEAFAVQDGGGATLFAGAFAHSYRRRPMRHAVAQLPAPVVTRTLRLVATTARPLVAGVAAAGLSVRPASGHEWGAGRPIADPGRAERLLDGGFAVQRGGVGGGWSWTMPALTDDEAERLYALSLDAGTGETVLVVEAGDAPVAANERLHWGLLTKLEPFARQQPGETKWAMQVQDWA